MKKRMLALLLGGILAIGGGSLAVPVTAQAAELCTNPKGHFSSWTLTPGNGQITIQWVSNIPDLCKESLTNNYMSFYLAEKEIEDAENKTGSELGSEKDDEAPEWSRLAEGQANGCVVKGLINGTTYYVYADVKYQVDASGNNVYGNTEGMHKLLYVGSVTPDASLSNTPLVSPSNNGSSGSASSNNVSSGSVSVGSSDQEETVSYEEEVVDAIEAAPSGSTVVMAKGVSALSNSVMKELLAKGDVSLKMEFTYKDKEYVIVIPAGAALDNDIPWYGPLYLAQHFGNRAGTAAAAGAGGTYEVKSGDSLSKIAAASNMTLQQLLAKNPQIKDPNKISVGQKINR